MIKIITLKYKCGHAYSEKLQFSDGENPIYVDNYIKELTEKKSHRDCGQCNAKMLVEMADDLIPGVIEKRKKKIKLLMNNAKNKTQYREYRGIRGRLTR